VLRARLRQVSSDRPRWGYRRAHQLLIGEGWQINRKRTQRLWREEGLRVPRRVRKRRRVGSPRSRPGGYEPSVPGRCGRLTSGTTRPPTAAHCGG
jgi:transposase InsO family protein